MIYPNIDKKITQAERANLNDRIILSIARGKKDFTNEEIYNYYTGIGGLHGLNREDYSSYHEFSEAKKEFEQGQFFTPHDICRQMVEIAAPDVSDTVLDMGCGKGNFFNHLPNQFNAYGIDSDENAVKVAQRLYPDANISVDDMRFYDPQMTFDILLGNPPFNLDFDEVRSQHFFTIKAHWLLNPGGLMLLVMPMSYLASEQADRTYISWINRDFSFVGQTKLPDNAFSSLGVQNFGTKIMAFVRRSDSMDSHEYKPDDFIDIDELKEKVHAIKEIKRKLRLKLLREKNMFAEGSIESRLKDFKKSKVDAKKPGKTATVTLKGSLLDQLFKNLSVHEGTKSFEETLEKYLYELKTHKHLQKHYPKAAAIIAKYRNQKPPDEKEKREHWEKYIKLTKKKVLNKIYRFIKYQDVKPRKEYRLVKTQYGFKLKNLANPFSDRNTDKYVSMYNIVGNNTSLPELKKMTPKLQKDYRIAQKIIAKKKREFDLQSMQWKDMKTDPTLNKYINKLTFIGMKQTKCKFSDKQKEDMRLAFQKRYSLLNWQQGSGKTAVLYHYAKYLLKRNRVKNAIIVAPSIAIHMTWGVFLDYNKEDYVLITRPEHLDNLTEGKIGILSVSMFGRVEEDVRMFMKKRSQKICLLFDESDELTNEQSLRTKRTLKCFRRAKYKMLGTGTTTRNYVSELYAQFKLLYNNSVNMLCRCYDSYYEDSKGEIRIQTNNYFNKPYPARGGGYLFKACFNPGKATVFGIEKQNQDVYNKDHLWELIGKTIITRKFKEFAGDKYTIHTQTVTPSAGEYGVYEKVIKEFFEICNLYFNKTDDSRKNAQLELIRKIQLLIKSCSVPSLMPGYCSDSLPQKVLYIENMVRNIHDKVAVGVTTLDALEFYEEHFKQVFPERTLFVIKGDVTFKRRQKILREFEATENGILVCMQQSLKSSVNIPECNEVILESLQWNIPKMEQFYFRFIRFDSEGHTNVHFVNYSDSIEQNIMALILTKERLNDFIQTGEVTAESAIFDEFGVSTSIIDSLFTREKDKDGKFQISWGKQHVAA